MTAETRAPKPRSIREALHDNAEAKRAERARRPAPEPAPAPPARGPKGRRIRPPAPVDELKRFFPDRPASLMHIAPIRDLPDDPRAIEPYVGNDRIPVASQSATVVKPFRPAPRGAAAILDSLAKRGIRLIATGDGNVAVTAEAGRLDVPTREAINAALPLLRAHVHGTPLRCALPNHVGAEPPEAVTIVLGGAAACAGCVP